MTEGFHFLGLTRVPDINAGVPRVAHPWTRKIIHYVLSLSLLIFVKCVRFSYGARLLWSCARGLKIRYCPCQCVRCTSCLISNIVACRFFTRARPISSFSAVTDTTDILRLGDNVSCLSYSLSDDGFIQRVQFIKKAIIGLMPNAFIATLHVHTREITTTP